MVDAAIKKTLKEKLKEIFGFDAFRGEQEAIINNIVNQMTPTSPVSMPMVAATAVAAGAGITAISRYRNRGGRIR